MQIAVLTRWTSGRIKEYAIALPGGAYLADANGAIIRFHQKRAAVYCLALLQNRY